MSLGCSAARPAIGALRALVVGADCNARHYAEAGFTALTGTNSFFPSALNAVLVIMVAMLGYRLLLGLGSTRFSEVPMIALKVGIVFALTLQWPLFQTLVFDLAYDAPLEMAGATLHGGGSTVADADPLSGAQMAYDRLHKYSLELAGTNPTAAVSDNGPRGRASADLQRVARTLLMASAGVLAASFIAVAVLTALGPIFIALMLLTSTMGLFLGWLRALLTAALTPMLIWANTALMVEMLRPNLDALEAQMNAAVPDLSQVDQVVTIIEAFALAQTILIALGFVMATGLSFRRQKAAPAKNEPTRAPAPQAPIILARADQLAENLRHPNALRSAGASSIAGERTIISTSVRERLQAAPNMIPTQSRIGQTDRRARFSSRSDAMRSGGR